MSKNQNSLKQLNEIIAMLRGEAKTITKPAAIKSVTIRPEQEFDKSETDQLLPEAEVLPTYHSVSFKLDEKVRKGLLESVNTLGGYFKKNKADYNASYLDNISQKTYKMVMAINDVFQSDNVKKGLLITDSIGKKGDDLEIKHKENIKNAIAAIKDFHDAFRFTQTKNVILMGLGGAVLGAVFGLVAPFGIVPAAVLGAGMGMGTVPLLKRLFLGDIAKLEAMANAIKTAANTLLNEVKDIPISNKISNGKIQPPKTEHDEICRHDSRDDDLETRLTGGHTQKKSL